MRAGFLRLGLVLYTLSVFVFAMDLSAQITDNQLVYIGWNLHELIQTAVLFSLLIGLVLVWKGHLWFVAAPRADERQIQAARDGFYAALDKLLDDWQLSKAEREVAFMTMKGFTLNEIADIRDTSLSTIKTQSSAVYKKAGVNSRSQFVSAIIEELMN